jgi:hypothetical protein
MRRKYAYTEKGRFFIPFGQEESVAKDFDAVFVEKIPKFMTGEAPAKYWMERVGEPHLLFTSTGADSSIVEVRLVEISSPSYGAF